MTQGTLYGIGVGPGDPELMTVKGAAVLARCPHVFVPKARTAAGSVALAIAERYIGQDAHIHELLFPMTSDEEELARRWQENARTVAAVLETGEDACFLTLGDLFLYSTFIYLLREIRRLLPTVNAVSVPGITSFSAAAALASFPVGEGRAPVALIPAAADDPAAVREALGKPGTVILMKIGRRLPEILDLLEETGLMDRGVFVAHAGMEGQRVETDLRNLRNLGPEAGYLSILLVHTGKEEKR
ncbi:MAG: Cobalt-precorrin-2 C(20)-methyltransferase [Syntrophaceae bacterium PtaU1.Bin231]|nr:MAG: Cobalt-precorrin-2 C(20)-methyltransferase [Syntrophaceae bacterium PtaU1.Bin231]